MRKLNLTQLVEALKSGVTSAKVKDGDERTILVETEMGTVEMLNEITWDFTSRLGMAQLSIDQMVAKLKSGVRGAKVKDGDEKTILLVETDLGTIEMSNEISWDLIPRLVERPYSC